jgi:hypothetical protein
MAFIHNSGKDSYWKTIPAKMQIVPVNLKRLPLRATFKKKPGGG